MKKKECKTLLYVSDENNSGIILDFIHRNKNNELTTIIATSFAARLFLDKNNIPYKDYSNYIHNIDSNKYFELAKKLSYNICFNSELNNYTKTSFDLSIINLLMNRLFVIFFQYFLSYAIIKNIIEQEEPQIVYFINRKKLYEYLETYSLSGTPNTLEIEALIDICVEKKIKAIDINILNTKNNIKKTRQYITLFKSYLLKFCKKPNLLYWLNRKIKNVINKKNKNKIIYTEKNNFIDSTNNKKLYKKDENKKTLAIFVYGGYYYEQIEYSIHKLTEHNFQILLYFIEAEDLLKYENFEKIKNNKNIYLINKNNLIDNKKNKYKNISIKKIYSSIKIFMNGYDTLTTPFCKIIYSQLRNNSNSLYNYLVKYNNFIKHYKPDLLISQCSNSYTVLPFRINQIPTVLFEHGISYPLLMFNLYYLHYAEYFLFHGEEQKKIYINSFNSLKNNIFVLGEQRIEKSYVLNYDKEEIRKKYNISFEKFCIICDCAGYSSLVNRNAHLTYPLLQKTIELAKNNKNILFHFRVHHGTSYASIQDYIEYINLPNLKFTIPLNPLLIDIAQASDIVVSHISSSITEVLSLGIPVIYLSDGHSIDDYTSKIPCVKHARQLDDIQTCMDQIFNENKTKQNIRKETSEYFKNYLNIPNEISFTDRFIKIINNISSRKPISNNFDDYKKRTKILVNISK